MLDGIEERTLEINFKNYIYIYIYMCMCVCVFKGGYIICTIFVEFYHCNFN